jgi:hypothetical protein
MRRAVSKEVQQQNIRNGKDLFERSQKLVPESTLALRLSGGVATDDRFGRLTFQSLVFYDTVYAVYQHEGFDFRTGAPLQPGPRTALKPVTADGLPGRKFLENPYNRQRQKYQDNIAKGVQKVLARFKI